MQTPRNFWPRLFRARTAARYERQVLPRIVDWSWPFSSETPQAISVHVLTGRRHWPLAAWMLASWFHFSEHAWPVVIHDDGTLSDDARKVFQKLFPGARFIERREADAAVGPPLHQYPFCADFRKDHPVALKLIDTAHFAIGDRFILFDSDLLFFNYPHEILDWVKSGADECWFNEDPRESSLVTAAEARSELSIKIWSRVNTGLCLLTKSAIDLDLCDRALAQTSILRGSPTRIGQTLHMLCAARHGKGGLLPRTYEVSFGKHAAEQAISRHYTGPARDRFFAEGLQRLHGILFPVEKTAARDRS